MGFSSLRTTQQLFKFFAFIAVFLLLVILLRVLGIEQVRDRLVEGALVEHHLVLQDPQVVVTQRKSLVDGIVVEGRKQRVEAQAQGVLDHDRDDPAEQWAAHLEAGIEIDLDEPGLELPVEHEVEAKDLEVALPAAAVQDVVVGLHNIRHDGFHLRDDVSFQIEAPVGVRHVEVSLELGVGQLVARLVLLVVLIVLLDGVVCQMHHLVGQILEIELLGAGPYVSLLVPVGLDDAVDAGEHHVVPDVKLPPVVQEWFVDVGLDDVGFGLPVGVLLLLPDHLGHPAGLGQLYSIASVRVLPGFDYPYFLGIVPVLPPESFEFWIFRPSHIVSHRDHIEGVSFEVVSIVVQHRFEQVLLGTYAGVSWNMVGQDVAEILLVVRYGEAIPRDELFSLVAVLTRQDLLVQLEYLPLLRALGFFSLQAFPSMHHLGILGFALSAVDFLYFVLAPVEVDPLLFILVDYLQPKPAFQERADQQGIVAMTQPDFVSFNVGGVFGQLQGDVYLVGVVYLENEVQESFELFHVERVGV